MSYIQLGSDAKKAQLADGKAQAAAQQQANQTGQPVTIKLSTGVTFTAVPAAGSSPPPPSGGGGSIIPSLPSLPSAGGFPVIPVVIGVAALAAVAIFMSGGSKGE